MVEFWDKMKIYQQSTLIFSLFGFFIWIYYSYLGASHERNLWALAQ